MADAEEQETLMFEERVDSTPVYPIIHEIRRDIITYIDSPLSYEALTAPDITYTLVRPLTEKYSKMNNMSVVFCFLLNRFHFLRDKSFATGLVSATRASLCEILATRLLRDYADSPIAIANVVTTAWPVFSGAGRDVLDKADQDNDLDPDETVGNAIEMAILSSAKRFIKSQACQKVIDGIWSGKIVYQAISDRSILSDTYKRQPTHFYNPRKAPLLDHYRLKVPAIRSVLEYINFLMLFVLFVVALEGNVIERINFTEGVFMIFALGFTLDKVAAMQEHGLRVYSANLWNGFDIAFISIYVSYVSLRFYGIYADHKWARALGIDILAVAACIMFPRLAFVTLSNNLMVLSLRSMFVEFAALMLVAAFCFGGFFYALWTLGRENYQSPAIIAWWMIDIWFGLDATGFYEASTFHPFFGPVLMITYACLSNTLLLTVLVSILSYTFSTISADANAESMFRRAVSTIEGTKADALFSYQPPLNLLAFVTMLPASFILTPRWFHKVNVFMIRLTSCHILLAIAFYERQVMLNRPTNLIEAATLAAESVFDTLPRRLKRMTFFEGFMGAGPDIDAVFEIEDELSESRLQELANAEGPAANGEDQAKKAFPFPQHHQDLPPLAISPPTPLHRSPPSGNQLLEMQRQRPRIQSSESVNSPLSQLFMPLFGRDEGSSDSGNEPSSSLSYGPASRRLSQSRHRRSSTEPQGLVAAGFRSRLPSNVSAAKLLPETVQEIEDEGETSLADIMQQVNEMDERQKRMEKQMEQILQILKPSSTPDNMDQ